MHTLHLVLWKDSNFPYVCLTRLYKPCQYKPGLEELVSSTLNTSGVGCTSAGRQNYKYKWLVNKIMQALLSKFLIYHSDLAIQAIVNTCPKDVSFPYYIYLLTYLKISVSLNFILNGFYKDNIFKNCIKISSKRG